MQVNWLVTLTCVNGPETARSGSKDAFRFSNYIQAPLASIQNITATFYLHLPMEDTGPLNSTAGSLAPSLAANGQPSGCTVVVALFSLFSVPPSIQPGQQRASHGVPVMFYHPPKLPCTMPPIFFWILDTFFFPLEWKHHQEPHLPVFTLLFLFIYVSYCFKTHIYVFPGFRCCSGGCIPAPMECIAFSTLFACFTVFGLKPMPTPPGLL